MNYKMFFFGVFLGLFPGFFIGTIQRKNMVITGSSNTQFTPTPVVDSHSEFTSDNLLIRLNEARLKVGLPQLMYDSFLSKYAKEDLVDNCPVSSHDNFNTIYDKGTFKDYKQVAETLTSGESTPLEAVNSFLSSPTHNDVVTGITWSWTKVGIGVSTSPINCVSFIFGK